MMKILTNAICKKIGPSGKILVLGKFLLYKLVLWSMQVREADQGGGDPKFWKLVILQGPSNRKMVALQRPKFAPIGLFLKTFATSSAPKPILSFRLLLWGPCPRIFQLLGGGQNCPPNLKYWGGGKILKIPTYLVLKGQNFFRSLLKPVLWTILEGHPEKSF